MTTKRRRRRRRRGRTVVVVLVFSMSRAKVYTVLDHCGVTW
jgi:hypothetical protein